MMADPGEQRFFLVGFMGSGKTTLGRRVAARMELPFLDLDERIERSAEMSVPEIFSREGEPRFREREARALREILAEGDRGIIATGGGTFADPANRRLMKEAGVVVWLDCPLDQLLHRIDGGGRPLWTTQEEVRRLHERRREVYREADHRLELENLDPDRGADRLYELLVRFQPS